MILDPEYIEATGFGTNGNILILSCTIIVGGVREGNGRRREPVPTVEPPRVRETARQLAMAEGEKERLREIVREKQEEKETNRVKSAQSEKEQEADNVTTELMTQEILDETSGIMDIEEEDEDSEGDSQSEQEEEEV